MRLKARMEPYMIPTSRFLVACGLSLTASVAGAANLIEVYQQALQNDPQIREAEANRLASRESKPQALAALLPQVNATGAYNALPLGPVGNAEARR
jgi:outer membrane protein TolC